MLEKDSNTIFTRCNTFMYHFLTKSAALVKASGSNTLTPDKEVIPGSHGNTAAN